VDIVSKNGNLLVNIGPRSDGTIPDEVQTVLREVGSWLKINGEAIYGTRPWKIYGEGPTKIVEGAFHDTEAQPFTDSDFRFTTKKDVLYACELGWPTNGEAVIHSLGGAQLDGRKIASVSLLGSTSPIAFDGQNDGMHLRPPAQLLGKYAHCFKITLQPAR
jgi:alpha-L-fucosidase